MNFVGIITEYDPFHNGHAAQLAILRARGAQTIAVCMSSGAVQRGGVPLLPEPVRVQAALQAGADLVVALPGPYASAGAEDFAAAGVHLLGALGCDTLAFGAETPDAARLLEAARLLDQAALQPELRRRLAQGQTFAAARAAALQAVLPGGGELLRSPNNILGIEYCKALLRQKSNMQPCPLPRLGAGHGAQTPGRAGQIQIASASFLRAAVQKNGMAGMEAYVPCEAKELYKDAAARGLLLSPQRFSTALLALLRTRRAEELAAVRGCSEGNENRLRAAIRTADSAETPDAARLLEAARLLDQAALQPELHRRLAQGQTFAAARAAALQAVLPGGGELLRSPNNILGIEYCKALLRQKSNMQPCPLPRLGAGHGAQTPGRAGQIQIASASVLRAAVQKNGMAGMEAYVPCEAKELYKDAAARGLLLSPQRFSTALLALLRSRRAEELAAVRGCSEGIENRLRAAIRTADSAETLYGQMKTKRYPHARLRRLALDAALGVRAGALPPLPPFLHVLGARRAALGRLQQARLPASTSLARLERALPDQGEVFRLYQAFVDFSALCRETPQPMGLACTQKPVLL